MIKFKNISKEKPFMLFKDFYDIADDISGKKENYTLKHLYERLSIYQEENFKYEIIKVDLR